MGVEQAALNVGQSSAVSGAKIGLAINNLVQLFLNPPGAAPPAGASSGQQLGYFTNFANQMVKVIAAGLDIPLGLGNLATLLSLKDTLGLTGLPWAGTISKFLGLITDFLKAVNAYNNATDLVPLCAANYENAMNLFRARLDALNVLVRDNPPTPHNPPDPSNPTQTPSHSVPPVGAIDPNDKLTTGYGPQGFVCAPMPSATPSTSRTSRRPARRRSRSSSPINSPRTSIG